MRFLTAISLLAVLCTVQGFYLPGTAPKEYHDGDYAEVMANTLTSISTHLPYDFYDLPVCKPTKRSKGESENLGEILMGDRIKPSPYEGLFLKKNVVCAPVCPPISLTPQSTQTHKKMLEKLIEKISDEYDVNLILDNLPVITVNQQGVGQGGYSLGVALGAKDGNAAYLHNHMHFTVKYHTVDAWSAATSGSAVTNAPKDATPIHRIVAFQAKPYSIAHTATSCSDTLSLTGLPALQITANETNTIVWTYGVTWEESDEPWATRWDAYLNITDQDIHWFSIINSLTIVFFLSGMIAVIMMRTLRKDISKYNAAVELDAEDFQEETGWKLVHTDVFRPPPHQTLLSGYVGTGMQLLGMALTVIIFACLGFLSPANRGALFTAMLLCFAFLGVYSGYTSARLLKLWNNTNWRSIFVTATLLPGTIFAVFFLVNLFVWSQGSAAAVPFTTMLALMALWFCVAVPLVFLGAVLGYRKEAIKVPCRTHQIARHIPVQPWYLHPMITIPMGGVLPFGAVFIELFFILTAVWLNRYYYVFGFLFLVFIILSITCAEITIVMVYFQLCAEDYRWWWRSFLTSGSSAMYLFLYTVFYFFTSSLRMKRFVPILLYFGYMGCVSYVFLVLTGTIGFISSFIFVHLIYGSIRVE
jgi:transmembrane 9 superfamily protein 2/4